MLDCLLAATLMLAAAPQDPPAVICERFAAFDHDGDGQKEIERVQVLHQAGEQGARVVVLVEERIAARRDGLLDVTPHVERLVDDLANEGYTAIALRVQLAKSRRHQDGRFVLAMRELLRAFAADTDLAGAILIGHFPDALLVRTCNWRKRGTRKLHAGKDNERTYRGRFLRRVPEIVAHRADIVLSDLDGRWEDVYVQPRTLLPTVHATFEGEIPAAGGECLDVEHGELAFEDFFHVCDDEVKVDGRTVSLADPAGNLECSQQDGALPNAMAIPEIVVSRIDARGVALKVRDDVVGVSGEHLLDEDGMPQAVTFAERRLVPLWGNIWRMDAACERELLAEFLDRNHAYRTGSAKIAWRPTSISHGLGSGYFEMKKAGKNWLPANAKLSDVRKGASLSTVVDWLSFPAVIRTLRAHSDACNSVFKAGKLDELHAKLHGPIWSWSRKGNRLVPSLASPAKGGRLNWFLLHSLWKNGVTAKEPCFYHHTGCHGITPPASDRFPYDASCYGLRQGAESLMFFGNGLALVGRSKVFYDEPRGFGRALGDGKTFGAAWQRYFELEASAEKLGKVGGNIGRKRAYFWSVLGDWTLTLASRAPK